MTRPFKTLAYAAPRQWVNSLVKQLKDSGYSVQASYNDTIVAHLDQDIVFRALRTQGDSWLVRAEVGLFTEVQP